MAFFVKRRFQLGDDFRVFVLEEEAILAESLAWKSASRSAKSFDPKYLLKATPSCGSALESKHTKC